MLECPRCKHFRPWVWHDMPDDANRPEFMRGPRWAAPKIAPCGNCASDEGHERKRELDHRMATAGFPYVPFTLHKQLLLHQREDEGDQELIRRVVAHNRDGERRPMLGVLAVNRKAVLSIAATKPRERLRRSMFLYGPPGTGKTMLLCALGRLLLNADTRLRRWYLDGQGRRQEEADALSWDRSRPTALQRQRSMMSTYKRLDSLMEEHSNRFRGRAQPVRSLATYEGVLFFDEVGISESPTAIELDTVNYVLGKRADMHMPTVISSNLNPGEFTERYGPRVGSRLRSYLTLPVLGPDWRA